MTSRTEFTEAWAAEQLARAKAGWRDMEIAEDLNDDQGPESDLQRKAEAWLNERGYPYLHDRSRRKNKRGKILDLHIYLPKGRHVVVEFKAKGNKMSDEQKETYRKILFLGHEIYEVRSFKKFISIMMKSN